MILNKINIKEIQHKIGLKPSFLGFDSVVTMTLTKHHKVNPFVNNGAIAVTSLIRHYYKNDSFNKILNYFNNLANDKLTIDKKL